MTNTIFSDIQSFVRAPRLTGLNCSNDGRVIVTRAVINDDGSSFVTQLFDVTRHEARQLTHGNQSASLLAVGERGEVYFTREDPGSDAKGDAIWMLPPQGEAREIFRYHGGIEGLQVAGGKLLVTLSVLPEAVKENEEASVMLARSSELAKKRKDGKVSAILHERYPTRFWSSELGPGQARLFVSPAPPLVSPDLTIEELQEEKDGAEDNRPPQLPANELSLEEIALPDAPEGSHEWSLSAALAIPDGRGALVTMVRRTAIDPEEQVWFLDLAGGALPKLLKAEDAVDFSAEIVAPTSKWAVLAKMLPPLPNQTIAVTLQRADLETGAVSDLIQHFCNSIAIAPDDRVFFADDRQGRGGVYRIDDGHATLITPDDEYAYTGLCCAKDTLVALRSSIAEPPAVVFIDPLSGRVEPGPKLTPDFALPGAMTEIKTRATDGTALRAWLTLPEGQGPHPLVVFAHGGPWGSWNDWTWRWNPWVFVARGYAVLLPDPGISTGYGEEILSRGHDSIGDEPFTDIMALTDAALTRPDIDAERQLFAGGSYGGYMANWVAGHTGRRFMAIVTHASLWNTESMARTTDNGSWYRWMATPIPSGEHSGPPQNELWSPHLFAEQIEVPMLVVHGDRDYRVPISQGQELWFDLQRLSPELGHQFLYFPDEGHWILKPGNAEVWYQTFLLFLDQHSGVSAPTEGALSAIDSQ